MSLTAEHGRNGFVAIAFANYNHSGVTRQTTSDSILERGIFPAVRSTRRAGERSAQACGEREAVGPVGGRASAKAPGPTRSL